MNGNAALIRFLIRGGACLVVPLVLLYLCDVPSGQALDAPIWQALLLDGDDADPSEVKSLPLPDDQPGFASVSHGADRVRGGPFGHVSESILLPVGILLSSVLTRAPPLS
jgi:hypothetical protein